MNPDEYFDCYEDEAVNQEPAWKIVTDLAALDENKVASSLPDLIQRARQWCKRNREGT
jgi:hypothetical protein